MLGIAGVLIGGAFALALMERLGVDARPDGTVCISRLIFGLFCPGCGLTDSFVALAGGRFAAALEANWLGPALFALLVVVVLTRLVKARTSRWRGWNAIDLGLGIFGVGALVVRAAVFYFG